MKQKKHIGHAITVGALGMLLFATGCERPTKQESTYRTSFDNEYSWEGMGPDMRRWGIFTDVETVSHRREVVHFPPQQTAPEQAPQQDGQRVRRRSQLEIETEQSFVTADGQIMIQELIIAYNVKTDADSVKRHHIDHHPQQKYLLAKNLEGLCRTFLQTKSLGEVEGHQDKLGQELLGYLQAFKVGGTPIYDKAGNFTHFEGGYTIEQEWGIEITEVTPRKIRPPAYVRNAHNEKADIIARGRSEFESAQNHATQRLAKLNGRKQIIQKVGDDEEAISYLNNQAVTDMVERLGPGNIKHLKIYTGVANFGGDASPATARALDAPTYQK